MIITYKKESGSVIIHRTFTHSSFFLLSHNKDEHLPYCSTLLFAKKNR
jgi:hypothetical protein